MATTLDWVKVHELTDIRGHFGKGWNLRGREVEFGGKIDGYVNR